MPAERADESRPTSPFGQNPIGTLGRALDVRGRIGEARLHEACKILGSCARPSAREPWAPESFRVAVSTQTAALRDWADGQKLWISRDQLGLLERGGREHDLYPAVEPGQRMWKATKGGRFGLAWICEKLVGTPSDEFQPRFGTPLQYMTRLLLHNELVQGFNRLEGFIGEADRLTVVTSQRFIPGRNATPDEIESYFLQHRARRVCTGAWYEPARNVAIFDVGSSNLLWCGGVVVPIDVIPIRPTGYFRTRLRAAIGLTVSAARTKSGPEIAN